jgi:phosphoglycerol transferase MdoB-like AlkP superfamily enzyme
VLSFLPFVIFFGWMVYKQRIGLIASGIAPGPDMLLATAGALLVVAPWAFLSSGRGRILWAVLIDAILTLILFADIVYYRQFGDLVSIASLRFAGQLSTVGDSVTALLRPDDRWLFADIPLIAALALLPRVKPEGRLAWLRFDGLRKIAAGGLALLGAVIVTAVALIDPYLSAKYYGHSMVASRMGLINYHAFDIGSYVYRLTSRALPDGPAVAQVKAFVDPRRPANPEAAPLYGVAKGKNVIMIQWESMQAFPMNMVIDGQEVTPNLNRLAKESLNFTDFYTQTGQGVTSDADFIANCSAHPTRTGAVYYDYAANDFRCSPEVLREHGYKAVAVQGMQPDFWNLASVYPHVGFEKYYNIKDGLVLDEKIGIGLSDESFFRQTAQILKKLPQPYYSFVVSLTSHGPFDFEGLPHELKLGKFEGTEAGNYLHAVHYTDKALGHYLDQLKKDGTLDNAVVLLYGDHGGIFRGNKGIPDLLGIAEKDEVGWTRMEKRIPFLIRLPGGAHAGEQTHAAGQVDIAPTLAGLLGVPTDNAFYMGRNLLGEPTGIVPFYTGSAISDDLLYWAKEDSAGQCYDRATGGELPIERCTPLAEGAAKQLEASRLITTRDLVPALLKEK